MIILGTAVIGCMLVFSSTFAQDGPPALQPTPTLMPPSNSVRVVSLPFSDTFDITDYWLPGGAWQFDTESAYDGTGWFLDGTQRETDSILEYTRIIDLSGSLGAQLIFRQKGSLPGSDLIAVDLSFDGGQSWVMVDQQIGINTDWEAHAVSLADYRGQFVRLRLRAVTGTAMLDVTEEAPDTEEDTAPLVIGYWIDNLTIQYKMDDEELVEGPELPGTMLGLHLNLGADPTTVLNLVKRLRQAGHPMGTIKGTTGTEDLLNEIATVSPETVIVYRSLVTPWGQIDCPDPSKNPVSEAQVWMNGLSEYFDKVQADYYEIMNECVFYEGLYARSFPMDWLVPFSIEAMRIANTQGRCLLLFSFGGGTPEIHEFAQLVPALQYALEHPCQPGKYHGIALHTYSGDPNTLVSESDDWLGYRYKRFFAAVEPQLPDVVKLPVYFTETGPGNGYVQFSCEDITRDMIQYTDRLKADPYIKGFHVWTMGWGPVDVGPCLPLIGEALLSYYGPAAPPPP
jgi:hypothetical protein